MNRTLSHLQIAILAFLGLCCGGKATDKQKNDETREKASADSISHRIDRGKYLALNVAGCLYCHSHRDYKWFSGPTVSGTEGMGCQKFDKDFRGIPGIVYSRNTPPAAIRSWTDEKVIRAITQGISQKGDTLYPLMPYPHFNKMSKDDVLSIVAFLRTLSPIANEVPKRQLRIPIQVAVPSLPDNTLEKNLRPAYADRVEYGGDIFNHPPLADCSYNLLEN